MVLAKSQMKSLEPTLDILHKNIVVFPLPNERDIDLPEPLLALEQEYSRLQLEYDKLYQSVELMKSGKKNLFARKPKKRETMPPEDLEELNSTIEDIDTYFDLLPDLALDCIVGFMTKARDVRALFQVLSCPIRVERSFCNAIRSCYDKKGLIGAWFPDCGRYSEKCCHCPTVCPRCFLYGKAYCFTCKKGAKVGVGDILGVIRCNNIVKTKTKGLEVKCRELVFCPTCKFPYHPSEAEAVARQRDFDCQKYKTRFGCIHCTLECRWCANIGCNHSWHYEVNKDVHSPRVSWTDCDDCGKPHCCRLFRVMEDDYEWDELTCPVWEPISSEGLSSPPLQDSLQALQASSPPVDPSHCLIQYPECCRSPTLRRKIEGKIAPARTTNAQRRYLVAPRRRA